MVIFLSVGNYIFNLSYLKLFKKKFSPKNNYFVIFIYGFLGIFMSFILTTFMTFGV